MTPQCDEERHAAGDDLGRDEEGGPRHHHEQPRRQVVDVQVPAKLNIMGLVFQYVELILPVVEF